jgi:predicted regulator of Ras-like GTPase activity (Roadblock/LC7/MglB family)
MQSEEEITAIIKDMSDNLPGFIAASLVDLDSGMTLGVYSRRDDFDLTAASAYNSELVKQKVKIMEALGLQTDLEDLTMTLGDQIHMIALTESKLSFVYLAVERAGSNLAIMRKVMKSHVTEFTH